MAITFNEDTGVVVDDGATVRAAIATIFKNAFKIDEDTPELNTEPETPAGQLIDGITALVISKDSDLLYLSNMFNPETAMGVFQDALASIYFIDRKVAEATVVTCTCKGLYGTTIPKGAIVEDINGNQFTSSSSAQIGTGGEVDVIFTCTETGEITVDAGTVTKIITVVSGWDSVNNGNTGITGRDEETHTEFEQRRYDSVAKNSHGLAESVEGNINSLEGVIACHIEQNRASQTVETLGVEIPGHSVYLSVYGGEAEQIGYVMHNKLDAGCGTAGNTSVIITDNSNGSEHIYYYTQPKTQDVYIKITVNENAIYSEDNVKQAVLDNFNGVTDSFARIKMGETLYSSRFYEDVIEAGLNDLIKIEVSTDGENYDFSHDFNLDIMPVLDINNITFEEN